jgi:magnesium-transporting ATPase (P-type)
METEEQSGSPWIPDSALIIAVITATAYFWALWYELGNCNYFRISPSFVSLSSTSVLFTSTPFIIGIITLLLVWLILNQIHSFAIKTPKRMFFMIMSAIILVLFCLILLFYIDKEHRTIRIEASIALSLIVITLFLAPLCLQRKTGRTYWDKLEWHSV